MVGREISTLATISLSSSTRLSFQVSKTDSRSLIALVTRENILLARVDSIEHEYNQKIQLQNELTHSLNEAEIFCK